MSRKKRTAKVRRYPTDLNDKKWALISPLLPGGLPGGRPRKTSLRKLVNAILYIVRSGCAWRLLPHGFPAWQTVYGYYRRWTKNGTWLRIHDTLRAWVRQKAGRHKHPTAGAIDSQSVKTTALAGIKGLRRGQADPGPQAPYPGRHARIGHGRRGDGSIGSGTRRRKAPFQGVHGKLQKNTAHLGGWRLPWRKHGNMGRPTFPYRPANHFALR